MNNEFLEKVKKVLMDAYSDAVTCDLEKQYYILTKEVNYIIAMNTIKRDYDLLKSDGSWGKHEELRQDIIKFIKECYESCDK